MKQKLVFPAVLVWTLAAAFQSVTGADLSQATVRQKFNVVTLAPHPNSPSHPVAEGAVVRDDNIVRTGTESRAELQFTDLTLARLGANAIFSFDAQGRSIECDRGALLFSKPAKSGKVEIRAAGISAAITGSTGFVSITPKVSSKRGTMARVEEATTVLGMLEGKIKGSSAWRDAGGQAHSFQFALGPGDMLVAQPGQPPSVVQFDLPRFLKTSPLIKGFKGSLLNQADLDKAVAQYQADERRGFIDAVHVATSQPRNLAWVNYGVNHNSFDASVQELGRSTGTGGGGDFVNVGGDGIIRGQLVWMSDADLDLHLILPDQQEVFYANPNVTFNGGRANAMLDHDNLGGVIDERPDLRVENIAVNGVPSNGNYTFFAHSFFTDNGSDNFTLTVRGTNGRTQTISGSLPNGQNSSSVIVQVPPGG
jgi:hypothetical protein